jgi:hypothetical protein
VPCLVLVFSGIGGFLSSGLNRKAIPTLLLLLIATNPLVFFIIEASGHPIIRLHPVIRYCSIGLLLLPVSLIMGISFPCGMRFILEHPMGRVYSWAVNGSASVLSSIIASLYVRVVHMPLPYSLHFLPEGEKKAGRPGHFPVRTSPNRGRCPGGKPVLPLISYNRD